MTTVLGIISAENWYAAMVPHANTGGSENSVKDVQWLPVLCWERNHDDEDKPALYAWLNGSPPVRSDHVEDLSDTHVLGHYKYFTPEEVAEEKARDAWTWWSWSVDEHTESDSPGEGRKKDAPSPYL